VSQNENPFADDASLLALEAAKTIILQMHQKKIW
jgi:hypothetical protein